MSPLGAGVGLLAATGVLLAAWWWADRRPLSLTDRIAPFVRMAPATRHRVGDPTITLSTLMGRWRRVPRGRPAGLNGLHRLRRVVWAAVGSVAGLLLALLLGSQRMGVVAFVLAVVGGTTGWWAHDASLRQRNRRRQQHMARRLPMVADLLALAVGAGATPMGALTAATDALPGPLSDEVRASAGRVRSGVPVPTALTEMTDRVGLPELRRLVDSLLLATDLGTPLADVARAQAADIRSRQRRAWMEAAGRRDVAMLVPIVFLVLPGVVAIALYPGLQSFRLVVP